MCRLSVIIPVYNVENFLGTCLDSVLNQSFADFEVILINDGSMDASGEICNSYAKEDRRIKVFHLKNSGPSVARNFGLKQAIGEYLMFIDSDDYIIQDTFSLLIDTAEKNQASLVVYPYYEKNGDQLMYRKVTECFYNEIEGKRAFLKHVWLEDEWLASLVNKLYRTEVIRNNGLFFIEEFHIAEDYLFNLRYVDAAESAISINVPMYYYIRHESSVSSRIIYNKYDIALTLYRESMQLLMKYKLTDSKAIGKIYAEFATHLVRALYEPTRQGFQASIFHKLDEIRRYMNCREARSLFVARIDLSSFNQFAIFCLKNKQSLLYYFVFKLLNMHKGL
ncbi:glycosyltransferase family 2 protein [Bacillus marasmi]|uniref:glycosyltransferase family 2 protein n=1 Tax=Bacillus marasmi TaxID=1926279 RepID=UPI0011CBBDD1|nr:glycosyltransferase family 2 protein [Bacillus marasmi]